MSGARYHNQIPRKQIESALKKHNGNTSAAAQDLNIGRTTLRDWIADDVKLTIYRNVLLEYKVNVKKKLQPKEKPVPLELAKPESGLKISKQKKLRFVVTCAQNNTDLHIPFVKALKHYCEVNKAQLIVIPIRYKNVTAYIQGEDYKPWWPTELKDHYLNDEYHLNDNLVILGDLKIQATATKPLSGISAIAKSKSAIIGHPQLSMVMVPTPLNELPRQLLTTGSCSVKNYSTSKAGHRAAFHHTFGASVVEIDGDVFFTRQINAEDDGSFYDLDKHYTQDGHTDGHRAAGLVCGDIHNDFLDPDVMKATWTAPDSIVAICRPEHQFLHDVLDFYSANHHHRDNIYVRYAKFNSGLGSVENELTRLAMTHNDLWSDEDTYYHYISSNHNDALTRWLQEADPKHDPENALIYHKLQVYMLENTRMTANGSHIPNPMEYFLKGRLVNADKTFFHSRDERVNLHGIDLSQHGDRGPNGRRGTITQFSQTGYKSVIAHGHSPGIEKGCYQVGTSSRLKLEYNQGYSSWFHTHCLIYPNGKRTLINIVNGEWRLK